MIRNLLEKYESLGSMASKNEIFGTRKKDKLFGWNKYEDVIWGRKGNDKIYGYAKGDILYGESGNDQLFGDDGDDILIGGSGKDKINGGPGKNDIAKFMFGRESYSANKKGNKWIIEALSKKSINRDGKKIPLLMLNTSILKV